MAIKTLMTALLSLCLALLGAFLAEPARSAVSPAGAGCREGPARLCLLGRFAVQATWWDGGGFERVALAVPLASSGAGAFSFFGSGEADLLVRVVDERRTGGHFRVEAGAAAGAPFQLRVVDTVTGTEWTHRNARGEIAAVRDPSAFAPSGSREEAASTPDMEASDGSGAGWTVADFLEARDASRLAGQASPTVATLPGDGCQASVSDLCLLGGRLRVRADIGGGDHRRVAWATAGGGESGLFSTREGGDAEVAVRVVDGRAVNGYFWLLYSALTETRIEIEVEDLASGNSRRFVKAEGDPAGVAAVEALSASAAVVSVTLDPARAISKTLGDTGGFLEATDSRGTRYRLVVPPGALLGSLEVTMTPVATIGALPFSGGLRGAVYLQPEGILFGQSALLTITPSPELPASQQLSFAFRGLAGELSLAPPLAGQAALVLPVHRLGGYGVAAGTTADLTAQLGRLPTRESDKSRQRLAGLILPARRAANGAAPLPATVLALLQQDFVARIRPHLAAMKLGGLDLTFPAVRSWRNAAIDTGQGAKLAPQLKEITAAEIVGAKKSYDNASKSDGKATAPVCRGLNAATRMFRAFRLLKSHGAQRQVNEDALLRCARFELRFDTTLTGFVTQDATFHDEVQAIFPVLLDIPKGSFFGGRLVEHYVARADTKPPCTTTKVSAEVKSNLRVTRLDVPSFYWREDIASDVVPPPRMRFRIEPHSRLGWRLQCPERHIQPLPPIPAIDLPFDTTWSGAYTLFHAAELNRSVGAFEVNLDQSQDSRVYAEKKYLREPIPFHSEDTVFLLLFTPK